jgi:hypothetical protein
MAYLNCIPFSRYLTWQCINCWSRVDKRMLRLAYQETSGGCGLCEQIYWWWGKVFLQALQFPLPISLYQWMLAGTIDPSEIAIPLSSQGKYYDTTFACQEPSICNHTSLPNLHNFCTWYSIIKNHMNQAFKFVTCHIYLTHSYPSSCPTLLLPATINFSKNSN